MEWDWPGLAKEGGELCRLLGLPDINSLDGGVTKGEWKRLVTEACRVNDEEELKIRMERYSKMEMVKVQDCKQKYYIKGNLSDVRILFRYRMRMLACAGNFKNQHKYCGEGAFCGECGECDDQSHLLTCPSFEHLRGQDVYLENDDHLVKYLREVLRLREEREKK